MTRPFTPREPEPPGTADPAGERARKNAEGDALGAYQCPGCGDSAFWKPMHDTPYYLGPLKGDEVRLPDDSLGGSSEWRGALGIAALCADCWAAMTPEERLPHYEARVATWAAAVPGVWRVVTAAGLADDPADAARHAAAVAAADRTAAAVRAAVLEGK